MLSVGKLRNQEDKEKRSVLPSRSNWMLHRTITSWLLPWWWLKAFSCNFRTPVRNKELSSLCRTKWEATENQEDVRIRQSYHEVSIPGFFLPICVQSCKIRCRIEKPGFNTNPTHSGSCYSCSKFWLLSNRRINILHTHWIHIYIHTYIHTYTYIYTYVHTYVHTYIHTHILHIYICTYIHMYIYTYIHMYTYIQIHTICIHIHTKVSIIWLSTSCVVGSAEFFYPSCPLWVLKEAHSWNN